MGIFGTTCVIFENAPTMPHQVRQNAHFMKYGFLWVPWHCAQWYSLESIRVESIRVQKTVNFFIPQWNSSFGNYQEKWKKTTVILCPPFCVPSFSPSHDENADSTLPRRARASLIQVKIDKQWKLPNVPLKFNILFYQ